MTTKQYQVIFHSPGTMFDEMSAHEVAAWDPAIAARLARDVVERYDAKPYGFRFATRITAEPIPDGEGGTLRVEPKRIAESGTYFIAGKVLRFDDIADDREHSILRSNMRSNGWPLVCETANGYRAVRPFHAEDMIVDVAGNITDRGDSPEHAEYRAKTIAGWAAS